MRPRAGGKALMFLLMCIVGCVGVPHQTSAAPLNTDVHAVNVTAVGFAMAWDTNVDVHGHLLYGTSCATANNVLPIEPDSDGYVHLASTFDATGGVGAELQPNTQYYVKLVDDSAVDDNGGQCYTVRTLALMRLLPTPNTVVGHVGFGPGGSVWRPGIRVELAVTHNGVTSLPMATMTGYQGLWAIVAGAALDVQGQALFPVNGDLMTVTAAASDGDRASIQEVFAMPPNNPRTLPDICLPQVPPARADTTPPVIKPNLFPATAWSADPVDVSWQIDDPESTIIYTHGCSPTILTAETPGTTLTCTAYNDAGLSSTRSVTVRIDRTPPAVTFTGNAGSYTVDQTVSIVCSTSDSLSGVASSTCNNVSAPAYTFPLGMTTLSASAKDQAGNIGTGSTRFAVSVTYPSLCSLSRQFSTDPAFGSILCQILILAQRYADAGDQTAKATMLQVYASNVRSHVGYSLTGDQATTLVRLAAVL